MCFPFNHRKIRQAFSYAIQRAKIVDNAFQSLNAAYSPLLPHYLEINNHYFLIMTLIKHCSYLMKRWKTGIKSKRSQSITLLYNENELREYTALNLKQQFKEYLGIDCKLKCLPWNNVFHQMTTGDFQLGMMNWISWIDDPFYTLNAFRDAKTEINVSKWEHPDFQKLLKLGEQELDLFKRSMYFLEAEKILCQEMPVIPLYYQPSEALIQKKLHIIHPTLLSGFN